MQYLRRPEGSVDLLELKLQAAVHLQAWVLGARLRSPARTVSTLDLRVIPSASGMLPERGLYSSQSPQDVLPVCLLHSFLLAADFFIMVLSFLL